MYVSGGFENKIWIFRFMPGSMTPITPAAAGNAASIEAPFIDVNGFTDTAPSPRYNDNHAPVYPTGLAISPDGNSLYVANNLGDSLGIVKDVRGSRTFERIALTGKTPGLETHFTYPYAVVAIPQGPPVARDFKQFVSLSPTSPAPQRGDPAASTAKVFVSCWNDSSVAVINFSGKERIVKYVTVGQHPTAMLWDGTRSLLFVANSGDDSVSVIDTRDDRELGAHQCPLKGRCSARKHTGRSLPEREHALRGQRPQQLGRSGATVEAGPGWNLLTSDRWKGRARW
jgi:DNA-binding beta-propeller fold protein YncE